MTNQGRDKSRRTELVRHEEGLTLWVKKVLGLRNLGPARTAFNWVARLLPPSLTVAGIGWLRRRKHPYVLVRDGDVVVQVGAPSDLIHTGRSRAVQFARTVGSGRVVVIEPDPDNIRALETFAKKHGLLDRIRVVRKGAWSHRTELEFLSSQAHPASNVLANFERDIPDSLCARRDYKRITVSVDSLDSILRPNEVNSLRLLSITTNGAEREILKGARSVIRSGNPYVSLAITGDGYVTLMETLGYDLIAYDDRGYTFAPAGG